MAKQSSTQKKIVNRVMHEFKTGELEQRNGEPIEDRRQAVAIALSEAGASNQKTPAGNKKAFRHTTRQETSSAQQGSGTSRDALYADAQRRDIAGRSKMTKAQLQRALGA